MGLRDTLPLVVILSTMMAYVVYAEVQIYREDKKNRERLSSLVGAI